MKGSSLLAAAFANVSIWISLPALADEAATVEALRQAGFKVKQAAGAAEIGFGQPEWTPALWQRLGEVPSLTALRGTATCADNAGVEVLTKLPRLETLYLNASTFDDQGFAMLAKIRSLQSLSLDHNAGFTGCGAAALKSLPNLRSLRFGGCMKFTSDGVRAAAEIAQLESLQLHHCGVGDDDLAPLAGMPKLKSLFVSSQFNGRLTDAGLKHLVQIQTLESLKLAEFVVTSEGGLDVLTKLGRLKTLELLKVGVLAADIEKLRTAMPQTEIQWTAASDEEVAQFHRRAASARKLRR
jgi:hypothetical protein